MDYPYGAIAGDGKLSASFAWLHNFRRINTHYDYYAQNYLAFSGRVEGADGVLWLTGSIQAYRPDNLENLGVSP